MSKQTLLSKEDIAKLDRSKIAGFCNIDLPDDNSLEKESSATGALILTSLLIGGISAAAPYLLGKHFKDKELDTADRVLSDAKQYILGTALAAGAGGLTYGLTRNPRSKLVDRESAAVRGTDIVHMPAIHRSRKAIEMLQNRQRLGLPAPANVLDEEEEGELFKTSAAAAAGAAAGPASHLIAKILIWAGLAGGAAGYSKSRGTPAPKSVWEVPWFIPGLVGAAGITSLSSGMGRNLRKKREQVKLDDELRKTRTQLENELTAEIIDAEIRRNPELLSKQSGINWSSGGYRGSALGILAVIAALTAVGGFGTFLPIYKKLNPAYAREKGLNEAIRQKLYSEPPALHLSPLAKEEDEEPVLRIKV